MFLYLCWTVVTMTYCTETTIQLCLSYSSKLPPQKSFSSVNINKHSFVAAWKDTFYSKTTQWCNFFFTPPFSLSPLPHPSNPLSLQCSPPLSLRLLKWRHICMTKKETWVVFDMPLLSMPSPLSSSRMHRSLGTDNCWESCSLFLLVPLLGSNDGKPFEVQQG